MNSLKFHEVFGFPIVLVGTCGVNKMKGGAIPIVENNLQLYLGLSVRTERKKMVRKLFILLCEAFFNVHYSFLLISNKFCD
jgi:hypothetical protein